MLTHSGASSINNQEQNGATATAGIPVNRRGHRGAVRQSCTEEVMNPQALPVAFNTLEMTMTAPKTLKVGMTMDPKRSPPVAPSRIGKFPSLPSVQPFPDSEFCTAAFDVNGIGVPRLRANIRAKVAPIDCCCTARVICSPGCRILHLRIRERAMIQWIAPTDQLE